MSLCNKYISDRINRHFVPLYMTREKAVEWLAPRGVKLRENHNVVLIDEGGRPRNLTTRYILDHPEALARTVDDLIKELKLAEGEPLPAYVHPVPAGGLSVRVVTRYPGRVPDFRRDWIELSADEVRQLLPPDGTPTYEVSPAITRKVLVALRPAPENPAPERLSENDPEDQAIARLSQAALRARVVQTTGTQRTVSLEGNFHLAPREQSALRTVRRDGVEQQGAPSEAEQKTVGHWTYIVEAKASVLGFLRYDTATNKVSEIEIVTDSASMVLGPSNERFAYAGMARLYKTQ